MLVCLIVVNIVLISVLFTTEELQRFLEEFTTEDISDGMADMMLSNHDEREQHQTTTHQHKYMTQLVSISMYITMRVITNVCCLNAIASYCQSRIGYTRGGFG
jgi:hypothetical protein